MHEIRRRKLFSTPVLEPAGDDARKATHRHDDADEREYVFQNRLLHTASSDSDVRQVMPALRCATLGMFRRSGQAVGSNGTFLAPRDTRRADQRAKLHQ